ncbi:Uncharacterised protein [Shigella sonnei]|nr:Uncharacterised protein [Shigella sonnei]
MHHRIKNTQPHVPHRITNRHTAAAHLCQFLAKSRIPADIYRRFRRAIQIM